ncbi:pilus assembly protein N-terminal domain-containing protein [Halanaerobacter jeridensis]|uniref:Flp pilus assembly secretin CpaC n=1 Tax=Halanaerobacter jeridensis TaxID=706427 RepID=A0A938XTE0_9FIRM|nr:pilus assembly protein N-terminal domain-containing protein [Halanaerobacter jeridensis]MBM7557193.1 Flp pilus assembly secretin CpaC [Halanaerobacter jeridensis]
MRNNNRLLTVGLLVCFVVTIGTISYAKEVKRLEIPNGESQLVKIDNLGRVAVGNPKIADVIAISNQELLINGRSPGATTVHIWDQKGLKLYKVKITKEQSTVLNRLRQLINYKTVQVAKVNDTILLSGKLDNRNKSQRVEEIAKVFGEQVVNHIQVENSLQVLLEAQVFEVDKTVDNQLGIDWYGVGAQAGTKLESGTAVFDENLPQGTKFGIGSFERISKI